MGRGNKRQKGQWQQKGNKTFSHEHTEHQYALVIQKIRSVLPLKAYADGKMQIKDQADERVRNKLRCFRSLNGLQESVLKS